MVDVITTIYLVLMFIALYTFSLFIILTVKNRNNLFSYPKSKKTYSVSILIPAYNEQDTIKGTIDHVMALDYPKDKIEVIVINDGSKDKTKQIIIELKKQYKNLILIDNEKNLGKARSLNKAIAIAKGELIAVTDSDSFPSEQSLKRLAGFFDNSEMGAVTSFVKVRNREQSLLAKLQSLEYVLLGWVRKILDYVDSVFVTNGPLSVYRKVYVEKVGGFDPDTVTEDIDITWNLLSHGYKTGMCLAANVTTEVPHKFKPWLRQRVRWGLGGLQAIYKYKKMFFKKGMFGVFVLPFVSLSIIISIVAFLLSSYLIFKGIITRVIITGFSIVSEAPLLQLQTINLVPSVLIFYLAVLLVLALVFYQYALNKAGYEEKLSVKRFFKLLFYMVVYLTLYSGVWFIAIYRYIRRDYRW